MKLGFRGKIFLGFFALLLIQGIVMFFWISQVMKESLLQEIKSHGHSIGISLSARMVEPMLAMDFLRMKVLMDQTVQLDDDIFYTFVLDAQERPLIHTFKNGFPVELKDVNSVSDKQKGSMQLLDTGDHLIYDYAVPVFVNNNRLGTLRLGLLQTRAQNAANKITVSAIVTIILTIIMAGIVGTFLLNPVTKSIKKFHASTEKALRGDLDVRTAPSLKRNCWDIMQCNQKECPAYENFHHRCWYMAGTLCPSCVHGEYAKTIDSCRQCQVYKKCSGDEIQSLAESFDAMTLSLKDNIYDLKSAESIVNEQKALLQTILDAVPDFINIADMDNNIISVNKAFCDVYGYKEEEILGKNTNILRSSLTPKEVTREILPQTMKGGWSGELYNKRKDGSNFPIYLSTSVIKDDKGKPIALVGVSRDITERKRADEKIKEYSETLEQMVEERTKELNLALNDAEQARDKIDAILKSIADGLIVTDLDNRIVLMNHVVEDLLNIRLGEVLNKPLSSVIKEDTLRERFELAISKLESGYQFDFE